MSASLGFCQAMLRYTGMIKKDTLSAQPWRQVTMEVDRLPVRGADLHELEQAEYWAEVLPPKMIPQNKREQLNRLNSPFKLL